MLSRLSNYIFGGLFANPETETTPMIYETREAAGDWLLVDMPDQAIDNEDMDSESEEDDILSAVPMLMTEDMHEQPTVVLSYEDTADCDNYKKIQYSCYVDIQDNSDTKILNISDLQGESDYIYNLNEFPWLFPDDLLQNSTGAQEISNFNSETYYREFQKPSVHVQELTNALSQNYLNNDIEIFSPNFEEGICADRAIVKELTSLIVNEVQNSPMFEVQNSPMFEAQNSPMFEVQESSDFSDSEMQHNSNELRYSSDDELRDDSEMEENQDDSEDDRQRERVQKYLKLAVIPRRRKLPLTLCSMPVSDGSRARSRCVHAKNRHGATKKGMAKMLPPSVCARFHDVCNVKNPLYEHAADFQILPNSWDTNQTLHYPCKFSLAVAQCYSDTELASTTLAPFIAVLEAQVEKKEPSTPKQCSTLNDGNDHPEYLKRVFKLRDTALKIREAKNTALILGQVKEIKPAQEAILYDSKKYLTRSHLNRQNKNYLFQSSAKTNRRKNLQRNHSGANNNRRC